MATKRSSTAPTATDEAPAAADWCCTEVNVRKISYTWNIKNFSYCESEPGKSLESSLFPSENACGGHKWRLQLYPNGRCENCRGQVSLFLRLVPFEECTCRDILYLALFSENMLRAKAWFHILDSDLNYKYTTQGSLAGPFNRNYIWGWRCFIGRDVLFSSERGFLRDDCLRVMCELHIVFGSVNTSGQSSTHVFDIPTCQLSHDYGKMLETEKSCDVVFNVGGTEFRAHKNILAARCPVFAPMFEHDMLENSENKVNIPDIDPEVFHELLRFVYTGEAPNIKHFPMDLLVAAEKYALERLKAMCEKVIGSDLRVSTVANTLLFADMHNANQLKACAIDFICQHAEAVRKTDGWKALVQSQPALLFDVSTKLLARETASTDPPIKRTKFS